MNALINLLPRLRRREQSRSSPPAPARRWVKQPQTIVLGVLDISKEARDAIATQEQQAWQQPFEIAFPPQSPTESGASCSPAGKRETQQAFRASRASLPPVPPPTCPLPALPVSVSGLGAHPLPAAAAASLRDVPASELSRRRNFKGRPLDTSLPIPPMPTTPPPSRPYTPAAMSPSPPPPAPLHAPKHRVADPPVSHLPRLQRRSLPAIAPRPGSGSSSSGSGSTPGSTSTSEEEEEGQQQQQQQQERSTTPPGTPTAAVLAFPLPPRAAFTKHTSATSITAGAMAPNSATRAMFPIAERTSAIEPLVIVKRVSGATAHATPAPSPTAASAPVMHALLSSLDDVYADLHGADKLSLVSIPLSSVPSESSAEALAASSIPFPLFPSSSSSSVVDDDDDEEDLSELEGAWRSRYANTDADTDDGLPAWAVLPPTSSERQTWSCAYSFVAGRTHALGRYSAQGARSLPDLVQA
ncbi:hypothetical protein B0H17DRAFT_1254518 [Mycena rosella]|uniref:Uncharacterized protein n=1 Tax=Mycena rosella TaxID=1033263 RepID=A0AAD7CZJ3_MYCRO|nr:hypothetical protein B0H17DRAFT_1254518 [Mycena rosella]